MKARHSTNGETSKEMKVGIEDPIVGRESMATRYAMERGDVEKRIVKKPALKVKGKYLNNDCGSDDWLEAVLDINYFKLDFRLKKDFLNMDSRYAQKLEIASVHFSLFGRNIVQESISLEIHVRSFNST